MASSADANEANKQTAATSPAIINWIDPEAIERLKATSNGGTQDTVSLLPLWQVDEASVTELSDEERDEVLTTLENLIMERLHQQGEPTLRLEVLVREVWRPNRLLNLLMFVIPIPGSGPLLATRGGIVIEASILDLKSRTTIARFGCRKRGDLTSLFGIFGRASDATAAMKYCTERLLDALAIGKMPSEEPLPVTNEGSLPGG
jgi:hypothetical protein